MINKLNFEKYFFESKVQLGVQTDEAMHETGCIEAIFNITICLCL